MGLVEKGYGADDVDEVEVNFSSSVLTLERGDWIADKRRSQC